MGKSLFSGVSMNNTAGMTQCKGSTDDQTGMAARFTSFIMAWLLAILFCLAFWFGIYLLIRSFISTSTWQV